LSLKADILAKLLPVLYAHFVNKCDQIKTKTDHNTSGRLPAWEIRGVVALFGILLARLSTLLLADLPCGFSVFGYCDCKLLHFSIAPREILQS
jgi:hypothetical protein